MNSEHEEIEEAKQEYIEDCIDVRQLEARVKLAMKFGRLVVERPRNHWRVTALTWLRVVFVVSALALFFTVMVLELVSEDHTYQAREQQAHHHQQIKRVWDQAGHK